MVGEPGVKWIGRVKKIDVPNVARISLLSKGMRQVDILGRCW